MGRHSAVGTSVRLSWLRFPFNTQSPENSEERVDGSVLIGVGCEINKKELMECIFGVNQKILQQENEVVYLQNMFIVVFGLLLLITELTI